MGRPVEAGVRYLTSTPASGSNYDSISPWMPDMDRSVIVNQSGRLPAVRALEALRACLGTYPDLPPDVESRDDLRNGGKRICSASATNIVEAAMEAPRHSRSVYDAAPWQRGTPRATQQC
jgi:hypothetical protein